MPTDSQLIAEVASTVAAVLETLDGTLRPLSYPELRRGVEAGPIASRLSSKVGRLAWTLCERKGLVASTSPTHYRLTRAGAEALRIYQGQGSMR